MCIRDRRYREKQQQSLEQDRLLYVAVTRAKKELHLLANLEGMNKDTDAASSKTKTSEYKPTKGSFLAKIWPIVSGDFIDSLATQNREPTENDSCEVDQMPCHSYHSDAVIERLLE